jgi:transposase
MQSYSKEMRRDVLAACDAGEGTQAVALRFRCSESWVRRVKQERRELGKVAPCTTRRRTPKWAPLRERIVELITAQPDMTLQELKDALGTPLCRQTLCTALQRLKLTLKKSPDRRRTGPTRRSLAAGRMASPPSGIRSGTPRVHR